METFRLIESMNKSIINSLVKTSSSSIYQNNKLYSDSLIIDWESTNFYHSNKSAGSYVRIDFTYGCPYIEKIMLKSAINRDPYHWVIEGSPDGIHFKRIYKNDGIKLCEWAEFDSVGTIGCVENVVKTYELSKKGNYRSIILRHTGSDSNDQYYLTLAAIDFIGNYNYRLFSIICRKTSRNNMLFLSILILTFMI